MMKLKKYRSFFKASAQATLTYRVPMFIWVLNNMISVGAMVAVWLSASSQGLIGGYTKSELVTYYLWALFLDRLLHWMPFYEIVDHIRTGQIVIGTLIKPYSYFVAKLSEEAGWHSISSLTGIASFLVFAFFLREWLVLDFSLSKTFLLFLVIALAILVIFSISICMGLVAFWFTEVESLDRFYWILKTILGGRAIPLTFIPAGFFQTAVRILPFRYTFSFILEIYFERLTPGEIGAGLGIQFFWVLFFVFLYKIMWDRGRKVYSSFGQ